MLLGVEVAAVAAGGLLLAYVAPWWAPWLVGVALVPALAWVGNTSEKAILEHAFNPSKYVRLTAELTRQALMAARVGIKDASAIKFNREIYRDGPQADWKTRPYELVTEKRTVTAASVS